MNDDATLQIRARYNRLAPTYDLQEAVIARLAFRPWRMRLWSQVDGNWILDLGVGMGAHISRTTTENARKAGLEIDQARKCCFPADWSS